jgi:hypothetical protein
MSVAVSWTLGVVVDADALSQNPQPTGSVEVAFESLPSSTIVRPHSRERGRVARVRAPSVRTYRDNNSNDG